MFTSSCSMCLGIHKTLIKVVVTPSVARVRRQNINCSRARCDFHTHSLNTILSNYFTIIMCTAQHMDSFFSPSNWTNYIFRWSHIYASSKRKYKMQRARDDDERKKWRGSNVHKLEMCNLCLSFNLRLLWIHATNSITTLVYLVHYYYCCYSRNSCYWSYTTRRELLRRTRCVVSHDDG